MSRGDFTHLHTHSHYSLLEALPKISELVAAAAKDGQTALALTDNGNLYGAIEFYKECKENSLKPIIGVDFHVAPRSRTQKEHRVDDQTSRLVLLARNETGYRNLIQLVSKAHIEGFYYRPRIDRELIEQFSEGLVAILPSYGGEHAHAIRHGSAAHAEEILRWYKEIFDATGAPGCYAEITCHPEIAGHKEQMQGIYARAQSVGIPIVAAHDVYYLSPEDSLACDLVNKIRTGSVLDRNAETAPRDFSFLQRARMEELFADLPEALENSKRIADACNLELKLGAWVFPAFPIPTGSSADQELRALVDRGYAERGLEKNEEVLERAAYELSIIAKKGYAPYFLVVADLLRHAREKGILTNTRGSVAGSLVSYLCGITMVNPFEYKLPFERFLNPERPSPPDIDMDVADNRRDELIAYVREKYGEERTAQIGTFGTMMARAAVRDVARALGQPYGLGDTIAKLIPFGKQGFPVSIHTSLENVPELKQVYESDATSREILDLAQKIEGNARHVGVHAAGVVIAPGAVTEYVPIQLDPKGGKTITQYDMYAVEDAGLLKFDVLGLTNLSVLADVRERVRERLGIEVDLDRLPLDDEKTYNLLSSGQTHGVFQLAGGGMTSYLTNLEPSTIHDINAMVALYRPGPMAFIPAYIECKKNPKLIRYLDPRMEPILKNSYGVIVYQDDVLEIAIKLAGYSWLEADKFRKAMGKKIPAEMRAQKEKFTNGCAKHGMKKEAAQRLWEQIETFAAYGFNKCLTSDTLIRRRHNDNVEDIPLASLKKGDMVASFDEKSCTLKWQRVEHVTSMGQKPVLSLETKYVRIRATGNHPFLVRNPGARPQAHQSPIADTAWLDASFLKEGDFVASSKPRLGIFVDDANTFYGQRKNGWRVNYKRLSKLLGTLFDIQFIDYHIAMPRRNDPAYDRSAKYVKAMQRRYGNLISIKEKPLKYIWDPDRRCHVKKGNVDGDIMLEAITRADKLDVVAIMSGDGDYCTLEKKLREKRKRCFFIGFENVMAWELRQLHHLYLNRLRDFIEADAKKTKAPAEAGVPLLMQALYGSEDPPSSIFADNLMWQKIDTITESGVEEVWDIGVKNTHSFVANGLIVHNSHAASYGNLAYKTAYMKANFPVDYMAALLTADAGDVEKVAETVAECKRMGLKVLAPSVNESRGDFTIVDNNNILFGLYSIKNFGRGVADAIIAARESGPFKTIADFLSRVPDRNLNKKQLESLIQSGALDELEERGMLLAHVDLLLKYHREHMKIPSDQGSLFGSRGSPQAVLKLPSSTPATLEARLAWEKELLGLYISGHPLDKHKAKFTDPKKTIKYAKEHLRGVETVIAGFIEASRINMTKNGERMGFLKIADFSDAIEVVAFPRTFKEYGSLMTAGACIVVKGKISERNGEPSFVVERAKAL